MNFLCHDPNVHLVELSKIVSQNPPISPCVLKFLVNFVFYYLIA